MLVFVLDDGESIMMDNGATIHVHNAGKGRTKVAIDAPSTVAIHRTEVVEKVRKKHGLAGLWEAFAMVGRTK